MNTDRTIETIVEAWLVDGFTSEPDPESMLQNVRAGVAETPQRRHRWWPFGRSMRSPVSESGPTPARGFTMFSALKLIAAGVIVALFGGFLLTGILTTRQDGEVLPAAVTDSPGPEATPTAPSESPDPSVRTDILPGVNLSVEEIKPGVYRVENDGVRDLAKANNTDIVAGHDGSIWLLRPQRFVRLGDDEWHAWDDWDEWREWVGKPDLVDFEVAPDGTVWVQADHVVVSFDADGWTTHDTMGSFEFTPDGTFWAMWQDPPETWQERFGYLDEDGWQALGRPDGMRDLLVASPDDIWASTGGGIGPPHVVRFVDGAWQQLVGVEGTEARWARPGNPEGTDANITGGNAVGLGPDGTFWGVFGFLDYRSDKGDGGLVRFDGSEWSRWPLPNTGHYPSDLPPAEVAPDGSIWLSRWRKGADKCAGGVVHFDGVKRDRYLPGPCVEAIDINADGSVWVLAREKEGRKKPLHLYVITPEAVAANE